MNAKNLVTVRVLVVSGIVFETYEKNYQKQLTHLLKHDFYSEEDFWLYFIQVEKRSWKRENWSLDWPSKQSTLQSVEIIF